MHLSGSEALRPPCRNHLDLCTCASAHRHSHSAQREPCPPYPVTCFLPELVLEPVGTWKGIYAYAQEKELEAFSPKAVTRLLLIYCKASCSDCLLEVSRKPLLGVHPTTCFHIEASYFLKPRVCIPGENGLDFIWFLRLPSRGQGFLVHSQEASQGHLGVGTVAEATECGDTFRPSCYSS